MSTIGFAWELGANYGHLARSLPVALRLQERGHETVFVVRDLEVAYAQLTPSKIPYIGAPSLPRPPASVLSPVNYSQILLAAGYAQPGALPATLSAWINLWQRIKPDCIVIDHSPTALLAARVLDIPIVLLGTGFTIPPNCSPLPSLRPFETVSTAALCKSDDLILSSIHAAVRQFSTKEFSSVAELFTGLSALITSFAELDHYGERAGPDYIGPVEASNSHPTREWRSTDRPRVFAYLRMGMPGLDPLLNDLRALDAEVICVIPGVAPSMMHRLHRPDFQLLAEPVDLTTLLPGCNLVVSYAGTGLMAAALIAGVPLLLIPQVVEQYLGAKRVEALGAGIVVDQRRESSRLTRSLASLLTDGKYRESANAFARKYSSFDSGRAIDHAADVIGAAVRG